MPKEHAMRGEGLKKKKDKRTRAWRLRLRETKRLPD
jgi:hypothetical protein